MIAQGAITPDPPPRVDNPQTHHGLPVFIHIPKTAGATVTGIIKRQYKPFYPFPLDAPKYRFHFVRNPQELDAFGQWYDSLPPRIRHHLPFIYGHMMFQYDIERFLNRPCRYFTFVRDPVERTLSHYYFYLRATNTADAPRVSLEAFAHRGDMKNYQTRWLTSAAGFQGSPQQMLEAAIDNLENRFFFVGITERFDESILMLQNLLHWKTPYYFKVNEAKMRPRRDQIPPETLEQIKACNTLDQQLYEYALKRFNTCLSQQDPDFFKALEAFGKTNTVVGALYGTGFRLLHPVFKKLKG